MIRSLEIYVHERGRGGGVANVQYTDTRGENGIMISIYFCTGLFGLPKRSGKLKTINKFDATFFGVHPKQADSMDPQLRMLLEVTYEAIVDSGKRIQLYQIFV
mgnify:CR=1 FL=1